MCLLQQISVLFGSVDRSNNFILEKGPGALISGVYLIRKKMWAGLFRSPHHFFVMGLISSRFWFNRALGEKYLRLVIFKLGWEQTALAPIGPLHKA